MFYTEYGFFFCFWLFIKIHRKSSSICHFYSYFHKIKYKKRRKDNMYIYDNETKLFLEMPGIEPGAFHMQSERSTAELHPHRWRCIDVFANFSTPLAPNPLTLSSWGFFWIRYQDAGCILIKDPKTKCWITGNFDNTFPTKKKQRFFFDI